MAGRIHDKNKVLAKLARAGLRPNKDNRIDVGACKHDVGNSTLGELDYLAKVHGIHYGRTDKYGNLVLIN